MLGKLKDMAGAASSEKALASIEPLVREYLAKAQAIGIEVIQSDARYLEQIVAPAYAASVAASHGVTKLIPEFKARFERVMLLARSELLLVEATSVRLVDDFKERLPNVLAAGFKV